MQDFFLWFVEEWWLAFFSPNVAGRLTVLFFVFVQEKRRRETESLVADRDGQLRHLRERLSNEEEECDVKSSRCVSPKTDWHWSCSAGERDEDPVWTGELRGGVWTDRGGCSWTSQKESWIELRNLQIDSLELTWKWRTASWKTIFHTTNRWLSTSMLVPGRVSKFRFSNSFAAQEPAPNGLFSHPTRQTAWVALENQTHKQITGNTRPLSWRFGRSEFDASRRFYSMKAT